MAFAVTLQLPFPAVQNDFPIWSSKSLLFCTSGAKSLALGVALQITVFVCSQRSGVNNVEKSLFAVI